MLMQIFLHTIKYVCKINGIIPHTQIIQLYFTQILLNSTLVNIDCNHIAHYNALFLLSLHPKKVQNISIENPRKTRKMHFFEKKLPKHLEVSRKTPTFALAIQKYSNR